MSKNVGPTPRGGVHSVRHLWSPKRGFRLDGGRPERERCTPANIGNGPYCDNGEGVAMPTPLPTETLSSPNFFAQRIFGLAPSLALPNTENVGVYDNLGKY